MARGDGRGLTYLAAIAAAGVTVLAVVTQCVEVAEPQPLGPDDGVTSVDIVVEGASPDLTEWTDPATGCAYLVHRLGGVTPRLNGAGRPLCRGAISRGGRG